MASAGDNSKTPDMELRKAFGELQSKMVDNKQKMKMADMQIANFHRTITHSELTGGEIKNLPEETRLYESVGRMFILSSRSEVTKRLADKQSNCKDKIKNLEANKTYLERTLKDSENSLRELISIKRTVQ
jgi:prefoldin subunit 1